MAEQKPTIQPPKTLLVFVAILQKINPAWATAFALRLFFKPIAFPYPQREKPWLDKWLARDLEVQGRSVRFYHLPGSGKRVLLVHGWSGRGTQMAWIAQALNEKNLDVWIMDGPGHGQSERGPSSLFDFMHAIHEAHRVLGTFHYGIGHSLGGLALLGAGVRGIAWEKLVMIGTPNRISDVIHRFCNTLRVNEKVEQRMVQFLEQKYRDAVDSWAAERLLSEADFPGMIVHDEQDFDVPLTDTEQMIAHWPSGQIYRTAGLGHRRILLDQKVIKKVVSYVADSSNNP